MVDESQGVLMGDVPGEPGASPEGEEEGEEEEASERNPSRRAEASPDGEDEGDRGWDDPREREEEERQVEHRQAWARLEEGGGGAEGPVEVAWHGQPPGDEEGEDYDLGDRCRARDARGVARNDREDVEMVEQLEMSYGPPNPTYSVYDTLKVTRAPQAVRSGAFGRPGWRRHGESCMRILCYPFVR